MSMLKLKANEKNKLKFEVNVQGATEPITEIRLSLSDKEMIQSYPCSLKNNIVEVEISNLTRDDDFNKFMLEIFIGNKYFSPVDGELEIIKPVVIESKMQEVENDEPTVSIKSTTQDKAENIISVNSIVHEIEKPTINEEKVKEIKDDISEIFHKETKKVIKEEEVKEEDNDIILNKVDNLFKK